MEAASFLIGEVVNQALHSTIDFRIDAELVKALVERGTADAELARDLRQISSVLQQEALDAFALCLEFRAICGADPEGHDDAALQIGQRSLHDVLQLSHVPGPAVCLELCVGLVRDLRRGDKA